MADQFGNVADTDLVQELQKKGQITLANQAIDDVKVFFSTMVLFIKNMYSFNVEEMDYRELNEDIAKLVINNILKDDVLKVLVCLMRIDCYDQDKDLRVKYLMLKGVQTSDFGIDPYLSMNDAAVFCKEAAKKYGLDHFSIATDGTP